MILIYLSAFRRKRVSHFKRGLADSLRHPLNLNKINIGGDIVDFLLENDHYWQFPSQFSVQKTMDILFDGHRCESDIPF